jgi:hypothetical protein
VPKAGDLLIVPSCRGDVLSLEDWIMRSGRNFVLGLVLVTLAVAGSLWAESSGSSLPVIRGGQKTQQLAAASIIYNTDYYEPIQKAAEEYYHAQISNPNVPLQEKCNVALRHGRLQLLASDLGGSLGGTRESATSVLWARILCPQGETVLEIPANFVVDTAPHPEEVQAMSFDTDMHSIEGKIADTGIFASFHIIGGTANGYPSPGHTSLIPMDDGSFAVDSTFNVGYRIEFVGAKGGPLDGASGTIESSVLMKAVGK